MPTTPNNQIDHWEPSGNPEVALNDALDDLDGRLSGYLVVATGDADVNLETTQDADGDAVAFRNAAFEFTGALTAGRTVTLPDAPGLYWVWNNTTGGYDLTFAAAGGTATVTVSPGEFAVLVVEADDFDVRKTGGFTPSTAPAESMVSTSDATETTLAEIAIPVDGYLTVEGFVTGFEAATGDLISLRYLASAVNLSGTSSLVDQDRSAVIRSAGATAWAVAIDVDDTADTLRVRVTGEAAHDIDWTDQRRSMS